MHQYPTPNEVTYMLGDSAGNTYIVSVDLGARLIELASGGGHPLTVLSFDLSHKANPNRSLTDLIRTLEACSDMLRDPAGIILASKPTDSDTDLPF